MKKFLFLFSMMFMTCSTVNVTLKADATTEPLNTRIFNAIKKSVATSKSLLQDSTELASIVLKDIVSFSYFPVERSISMLENMTNAIYKKSLSNAGKAILDAVGITLWIAAAVLIVHGATIAAQFLAKVGIVGAQTVAGFELMDKYTFLNPYFQYIVGLYKQIPGLPRHIASSLACGLPCAVASIFA